MPIAHAARIGSPDARPGKVVNRATPPTEERGFVQPEHPAPVLASIHTEYPAVFEVFTLP